MEIVVNLFHAIGLDFYDFAAAAAVLLVGTLLLSLLGRFVFGKQSVLCSAISSAIGIIFIYVLTVILEGIGLHLDDFLAPLPFVTIGNNILTLFSFTSAHYTTICSEILSMVILAFLMNLVDRWLPCGKKILDWLLWRCLTVLLAFSLHLLVVWLFRVLLPQDLATYAPTVLLGLLIIMLLTGCLKPVVGALLTTVDPIIGGLYTFFFATFIGKQVSKALLTTLLLAGLVLLLRYLGVVIISISLIALYAYVPFLLILLVIWYVVGRLL